MSIVTTYLWFEKDAEQAAEFYASVVPNSQVTEVSHGPDGNVLVVTLSLDGQQFALLNGGPQFAPTDFASIFVECQNQAEVDQLWDKLLEGGEPTQCGWLKDRYGVSWQVIPRELPGLLTDPNPAKAKAAMEAMFPMQKIDIQVIKDAHAAA